jgi:hypothetical protein
MSDENKSKVHIGSIGGDLSGNVAGDSITIIGSTLSNTSKRAQSLGQADDRAELEQLIEQLKAALEKVPGDKQEEAQMVAEYTEALVEEATKEKPKKSKLEITGEGLKKAAQNLVGVAPLVGEIAVKIVTKILSTGT